jgi:hypothetical protein
MIQTYIPYGDVPATVVAGIRELQWFKNDAEQRYEVDPHPTLKPRDVSYRFNDHGYRCGEFSERGDINIVFIGCSWVFGTGVPVEATACSLFAKRVADHMGKRVVAWNLAFPGKSNDYVTRVLLCALPVLRPDVAFVNFTFSARREYLPIDGPELNLLSSPASLKTVEGRVRRSLYSNLLALASEREDRMNLFRNYKLVELSLNAQRVQWLYSANLFKEFSSLESHIDRHRFVLPGLQVLDRARDNSHPGVESNRHFADQIFSRFLEVYASGN